VRDGEEGGPRRDSEKKEKGKCGVVSRDTSRDIGHYREH
jgi:hypothetical protein